MELPRVGLRSSECLADNTDDIFDECNGEIFTLSDEGRGSKATHDNHSQNFAQEAGATGDGSRKKRRKKSEGAVVPTKLRHSC